MRSLKEDKIEQRIGRKTKKAALGKGLSALIPEFDSDGYEAEDKRASCPVDRIRPNRYQPRTRFNEEELEELSRSIAQQGVIQPLLVRADEDGYELIAGERRLRAAKLAGLKEVPVVVRTVDDNAMLEMSIVENIQREDLNPLEEADAYHQLMTQFSLTQEEVSAKVGKSRSAVANILRLRQLPDPIKETILEGHLSMGHARALLAARNSAVQTAAWRKAMIRGLSVRETEKLVKKLNSAKQDAQPTPEPTDAYFTGLSEELSRRFGTKVLIRRRGRKGKLEVEFYSDEDLERILDLLR